MNANKIMIHSIIAVLLVIIKSQSAEHSTQNIRVLSLTTDPHKHNQAGVAKFLDAEHRGEEFYSYGTLTEETNSRETSITSLSVPPDTPSTTSSSSEASSALTSLERKEIKQNTHRNCTRCPKDMLKKWKNRGIKWICGTYQRARRTFKSECMMRYRNCQDGTMFIKSANHRCKDNAFHGRHWFYVYHV